MQLDADAIDGTGRVPVTLAGGRVGVGLVGGAEDAVEVEVHEAREAEAEHGAREDEPQDEIVPVGKADGVVELAHGSDEAVSRGMLGDNHGCGVSEQAVM